MKVFPVLAAVALIVPGAAIAQSADHDAHTSAPSKKDKRNKDRVADPAANTAPADTTAPAGSATGTPATDPSTLPAPTPAPTDSSQPAPTPPQG